MKKLSFLARTSLIIAFFFFIDKVLAFVRVGIISRQYANAVELLDTFNAANNLPDVLFALISGGALAMAFIPLMSEYLTTRGRESAWELFSRVANLAFVVTGSLALVVAIFAEPIVNAEMRHCPRVWPGATSIAGGADEAESYRHVDLLDQRPGDGRIADQPAIHPARHGADHV